MPNMGFPSQACEWDWGRGGGGAWNPKFGAWEMIQPNVLEIMVMGHPTNSNLWLEVFEETDSNTPKLKSHRP